MHHFILSVKYFSDTGDHRHFLISFHIAQWTDVSSGTHESRETSFTYLRADGGSRKGKHLTFVLESRVTFLDPEADADRAVPSAE